MKRRGFVQTSVMAVATGVATVSKQTLAGDIPTSPSEIAMTDPKLIESLETIFGEHMDAELAGNLDKTWRSSPEIPDTELRII